MPNKLRYILGGTSPLALWLAVRGTSMSCSCGAATPSISRYPSRYATPLKALYFHPVHLPKQR